MKQIHLLRWAIIIFIAGVCVLLVGIQFKIRHWPYGSLLYTMGSVMYITGFLLVILKLLTQKKKS